MLSANVASSAPICVGLPDATAASPFGRLLGIPVVLCEATPTAGSAGDIALVDFSKYVVINSALKTDLSADVRFVNDEIVWRFVLRVDGKPVYASSVLQYNSDTRVSPYIALDARA